MLKRLLRIRIFIKVLFGVTIVLLSLLFFIGGKKLFSDTKRKHFFLQPNFKENKLLANGRIKNKVLEKNLSVKNGLLGSTIKPALSKPKSYEPTGIGEFGIKEELSGLSKYEKKKENKLRAEYGINQFLSEKISLHRTLNDPRPPSCLEDGPFNYTSLPSTSVIVVFYNEGMSTLLRTIYSILHNTDDRLLKELILVDDYSDKPHLKQSLEEKIKDLPKTKLYRTQRREGIVKSRLFGVSLSTGKVVAFVDCHCECTVGWLEPLLASIQDDNSTLAVPVTDDIDSETFQYYYGDYSSPNIGGFRWNLDFHWRPMSLSQRKNRKSYSEPIQTPTISGGLFAINRKYFSRIGSYDSGMKVWGGENVEIAFRTWMCGGRVLIHPCSHIGHISRNILSYSRKSFWGNVMRAASVWLHGHYKRIFLTELSSSGPTFDSGDVTERRKFVESLQCHDFDWYLTNVYPEKYIPELRNGTFGVIQSLSSSLCIDRSVMSTSFSVYTCHGQSNQFFELNSLGQLRNDDDCLCVRNDLLIHISECPEKGVPIGKDMKWKLSKDGHLINLLTNWCIELMTFNKDLQLKLNRCRANIAGQRWKFVDLSNL